MEKKQDSKKSQKEIEKKIIELAKKGLTAEKIGENLRKEGIHTKEHAIKISKILKKEKIYTIPEIKNLENKLERVRAHSEKNKQDKRAKREKNRIFSHLRKPKIFHKIPLK